MKSKLLPKLILLLAAPVVLASTLNAQAKPDLFVKELAMTIQKQRGLIHQLTFRVNVENYCHGTIAAEHNLNLTVITDDAAHTINRNVIPLKGGQNVWMTIQISKSDVGGAVYFRDLLFKSLNNTGAAPRVLLKLDMGGKVDEANENNNWRQLNPDKAPSKFSGQFQCSPKV